MSGTVTTYDVAVVGAGPGGYVAAIRAAQLGARVALIEKDTVGGTCLNRGCIPTKAMVAAVEAYKAAGRGAQFGFTVDGLRPDFPAMIAHSRATVERLVKGVEYLLRKNKISVLRGRAAFAGPHALSVQTADGIEAVEAANVIVATGSKPAVFAAFGYDGERVVTSDEVMRLRTMPERLAIIGGGVIGCEFASIFRGLGAQVTVIEALPSILPALDAEVTRHLASLFRRQGIQVLTGAKVERVEKGEDLTVHLAGASPITCDLVLVAVGRRPNTAGLALDQAGVELNAKGEIAVDDCMRASAPGVYAIGDVTNTPWKLAHVASHQGLVAAAQCAGRNERMDYSAVPAAVFTAPEVAAVGLTTAAAAESRREVVSAKFPFTALGKAVAEGHTDGFVKLLADKETGRVVGAHIIGPQASTLIAEAALAVRYGLTAEQLASVIRAHPTLPEGLGEAAAGLHGMAIHA